MELAFGQEAYSAHFDAFVRHYLTLKTGDIPNMRAVYQAFKIYASVGSAAVAIRQASACYRWLLGGRVDGCDTPWRVVDWRAGMAMIACRARLAVR
jgi:hypothetical protein